MYTSYRPCEQHSKQEMFTVQAKLVYGRRIPFQPAQTSAVFLAKRRRRLAQSMNRRSRLGRFEKVLNDVRNALDLSIRELRIDGQAQTFAGGFFGDGKVTLLISQMSIGLLQVEGERVMQSTADLVGLEMLFELIAARMAHYIQVPRTLRKGRFAGQLERSVRQQLVVTMGDTPTAAGPGIEVFQFYSKDRALDAFHTVIISNFVM